LSTACGLANSLRACHCSTACGFRQQPAGFEFALLIAPCVRAGLGDHVACEPSALSSKARKRRELSQKKNLKAKIVVLKKTKCAT
jgi:hypothetical protein